MEDKVKILHLEDQVKKLQAFKDYVHERLDKMNVPAHPEGEHSKAGCRIGDRLDIIEKMKHFNYITDEKRDAIRDAYMTKWKEGNKEYPKEFADVYWSGINDGMVNLLNWMRLAAPPK